MATKTPGPRKVAYFYDDEIGNYHYGCVQATISAPCIFFLLVLLAHESF
jgi:hypothetical protein